MEKIWGFMSNVTMREVGFLIFGIILGLILMKMLKSSSVIKVISKKPAESILTIIIVFVVFLEFFRQDAFNNWASTLLSFISTMAFSWIMTKYSVEIDSENKQKEISAISYKHSVGVRDKLNLTLTEMDKYIEEVNRCSCMGTSSCDFKIKLENIKSQVNYSYQDAISNSNDWAVNISEEISGYEQIQKLDRKIEEKENELNELVQTDKNNDNSYSLRREIRKLKNNKNEIIASINPKILYLIDASKRYENENITKSIKNKIGGKLSRKSQHSKTTGQAM